MRARLCCCAAAALSPPPSHPPPRPTPLCTRPAPRSYNVLLPDGTHTQLTAAAQLGRLYVAAASAPEGVWQESGAALREAALSFRLRYKR